MSVKRRKGSKTYYTNFSHNGQRIRRSTGTTNKVQAQEYEDKLKERLWRQVRLDDKPLYTWPEAAYRYVQENKLKSAYEQERDKHKILELNKLIGDLPLEAINSEKIKTIINHLVHQNKSHATVNRYITVLGAILNKAAREWQDAKGKHYWLSKSPRIKRLPEPKKRIRWITHEEADRLIASAPPHYAAMIIFSLATGLRQSNVLRLEWSEVNLATKHAWVSPDKSKSKKPISVPLNEDALAILRKQIGSHPVYVFTRKTKPIKSIDSGTWKNILKKAGIENFKWHDLRHTWASWHVQSGTPLHILKELGGWSTMDMVLRYAHLSGNQLQSAASHIEFMQKNRHKIGTVKNCTSRKKHASGK